MMGKGNINETLEEDRMIECLTFISSTKPSMENDPHSEFILWGYKVIENEDQSKEPMVMPIYRVAPLDNSNTKLSISPPIINNHQHGNLSSSLSSMQSTFAVSSPISIQPVIPSQSPLMTNVPNDNKDHDSTRSYQIRIHERQKPSRQQYSPKVTKCLKQAFVDTIGQDRKLTKDLRKKVMDETGLNSRSLTYWFSNRKRRPPFLAQQFKDSVKQSGGQVKTYEDFELWWALSKKNK